MFLSQTTYPVRDKDIKRREQLFFPSLFQTGLKKQADIRVFFMFDFVYSVAIKDYKNIDNTDFRSSDTIVVVPFELEETVKSKLLQLASVMGLESGSADFVLTTSDTLYFLEINPVGQIDFISYLTNKNLEKDIAKILIKHGEKN